MAPWKNSGTMACHIEPLKFFHVLFFFVCGLKFFRALKFQTPFFFLSPELFPVSPNFCSGSCSSWTKLTNFVHDELSSFTHVYSHFSQSKRARVEVSVRYTEKNWKFISVQLLRHFQVVQTCNHWSTRESYWLQSEVVDRTLQHQMF